jgi:hypothetical protein
VWTLSSFENAKKMLSIWKEQWEIEMRFTMRLGEE